MTDKILYFNLRARAEPTRIVYALAGKPLVDERTTLEKWETLKAGMLVSTHIFLVQLNINL